MARHVRRCRQPAGARCCARSTCLHDLPEGDEQSTMILSSPPPQFGRCSKSRPSVHDCAFRSGSRVSDLSVPDQQRRVESKALLRSPGLDALPLRRAARSVSVPDLQAACGDPPRQRHHRLPALLPPWLTRPREKARRSALDDVPERSERGSNGNQVLRTAWTRSHGTCIGSRSTTRCPSRGVGDGSVGGLVARAWHQASLAVARCTGAGNVKSQFQI